MDGKLYLKFDRKMILLSNNDLNFVPSFLSKHYKTKLLHLIFMEFMRPKMCNYDFLQKKTSIDIKNAVVLQDRS